IYMEQYKNDDRIIYIKNCENLGGALARNVGIEASNGDYITFLDDDDEYLPVKIEKQVEFMESTKCDMSFTNLTVVNENKKVIDYRGYKKISNQDNENLFKY